MITSENNSLIKDIVKLKQRKYREKTNTFYVEGKRIVDEIPDNIEIYKYIISEDFDNKEDYKRAETILVSNEVFKKISDTVNPQGIIAICKMPKYSINLDKQGFYVVLDRICDPGNMGTIIRTAEALGVDGIFLSKGCVDLYNPKTLRATMGSIFHIPIIEIELESVLSDMKKKDIKIVCTHLKATKSPFEVNLKGGVAIIIGNEANGVLDKYEEMADILIKIPMLGKVESMNASISSAIVFYEVLSQRLRR